MIPVPICDNDPDLIIPQNVLKLTVSLKYFIVENIRTARRYLKKIDKNININDINFFILNKYTKQEEIQSFIQPVKNGFDIGIMSEAGCPGIADPGADIVNIAHKNNIKIVPLVGPSSIFLALSASGLNGQNFVFHGYLPIKQPDRINKLKLIENISKKEKQTQIFIETPYRNNSLLKDILNICQPSTLLCIASDITGENELIITKSIKQWKISAPDLNKKPTVFLLLAF
ncbi:MAG: SAM-dependent methyltransferase [Marinilabiliales bacterium]